jgi:hypothetical protein
MLLSLDNERVGRFIAQQLVIELGNPGPARLIPELKIARDETFFEELIDDLDP